MVLVDKVKVRGTESLGCPRVNLRLLAGVANPASMTVCEGGYISPCVEVTLSLSDSVAVGPVRLDGMLSSSDLTGMLFPAVTAGIPFPVGPVGRYGTLSPSDSDSVGPVGPYGMLSPYDSVGPVGLYGMLSPSDSESAGPYGTLSPFNSDSDGPVDPFGTLSPSDTVAVGHVGHDETLSSSDPAGILFPAIPAGILFPVGLVGPIGPYGTLSPSDSDSAILVDPGGTLPSSDLAGVMVADVSAGSASLVGPVGPAMTLGVLPPSNSDSADPVLPTRMLSSSDFECAGPLGPVGTLPPGDDGAGLFPIVPKSELLSVVAVPFPAERDPAVTRLPAEVLVGDCSDVIHRNVTEHSCRTVPEVVKNPVVVAMVGFDVMLMGEDTPLDYVDK